MSEQRKRHQITKDFAKTIEERARRLAFVNPEVVRQGSWFSNECRCGNNTQPSPAGGEIFLKCDLEEEPFVAGSDVLLTYKYASMRKSLEDSIEDYARDYFSVNGCDRCSHKLLVCVTLVQRTPGSEGGQQVDEEAPGDPEGQETL